MLILHSMFFWLPCVSSCLKNRIYTSFFIFFVAPGVACNSLAQSNDLDLTDLSLKELMNLEVVTANRTPQSLAQTAAAVFVISNEDIKQSGVTTIADALRMAPGVQVAKSSSHTWAVSIRGFNDRFSNKLLVLMDGRTIYDPLHSGVTWEVQDMILEDIDRIEVVRGPGAAMWGANAVNGVINIITKKSINTQGVLMTATGGNYERFQGQARFGGEASEATTYRLYGKYMDKAKGDEAIFLTGDDSWNMRQGGFRIDHSLSVKSEFILQGDIYEAKLDEVNLLVSSPLPVPIPTKSVRDMEGYHILSQWNYSIAKSNSFKAQLYYDTTAFNALFVDEDRDTLDFDFQHIFPIGHRQSLTWGIAYRWSRDDIEGTLQVDSLSEASRQDTLYSAFVQDEISFFNPNLKLIIGSKFEHNDYTSYEIQPSIRGIWLPAGDHSLWGAVSRAVRTPSRYEYDGVVRTPLGRDPATGKMSARVWQSSSDFDSEVLIAYETGYRQVVSKQFSFDLAFFYNDYDELSTLEPVGLTPVATPYGDVIVQHYIKGNKLSGYTWGGELVMNYRPLDWWRLQGVYSYLQMQLVNDSDSGDSNAEDLENDSPSSQFSLRSNMQFPQNFSLNLWLRYVGALSSEQTEAYWDGDIRVAWEPIEQLELALVGQNLFHESHKEMEQLSYLSLSTEVDRSVYLKLSWSY